MLSGWFRTLRELISSNEWTYWGIISFTIAIIGLFLFLFSKKIILRKIGFFGGLLFIVVSVFCNFSSYKLKKDALSRDYAIVFTPTITVKGSPAESGTELFVIHEGTKVKIRSTLGDWSEIEIADGNVGWMLSNGLEKI